MAKEELESKGYKVLETIIDKGYKVEEELKKIADSHLIIYQSLCGGWVSLGL